MTIIFMRDKLLLNFVNFNINLNYYMQIIIKIKALTFFLLSIFRVSHGENKTIGILIYGVRFGIKLEAYILAERIKLQRIHFIPTLEKRFIITPYHCSNTRYTL